jgi:hypothetical protein
VCFLSVIQTAMAFTVVIVAASCSDVIGVIIFGAPDAA